MPGPTRQPRRASGSRYPWRNAAPGLRSRRTGAPWRPPRHVRRRRYPRILALWGWRCPTAIPTYVASSCSSRARPRLRVLMVPLGRGTFCRGIPPPSPVFTPRSNRASLSLTTRHRGSRKGGHAQFHGAACAARFAIIVDRRAL